MESSAFSRVNSLFRYTRPAQWTAILTAIATPLLYALLVLLLAMFVDLLVNRGRIPNFAQLSVREQESAVREWTALSDDDKARALRHVGFNDLEGTPSAKLDSLPPETQARWRLFQSLEGGEGNEFPPVPGVANADNLRDWAAKRKYMGDAYLFASAEHEWRWRAYVWHYLDRHVGADAAERWQPAIDAKTDIAVPVLGEDSRKSYGILGMVVHQ